MPRVYTAQERRITARTGEEFRIELETNPTTGYEWVPEFDALKLSMVARRFASVGLAIGASTTEQLIFQALASGNTRLRLLYKRSWESTFASELSFDIEIQN